MNRSKYLYDRIQKRPASSFRNIQTKSYHNDPLCEANARRVVRYSHFPHSSTAALAATIRPSPPLHWNHFPQPKGPQKVNGLTRSRKRSTSLCLTINAAQKSYGILILTVPVVNFSVAFGGLEMCNSKILYSSTLKI